MTFTEHKTINFTKVLPMNSLPHNNILDWTKLKAIFEDK